MRAPQNHKRARTPIAQKPCVRASCMKTCTRVLARMLHPSKLSILFSSLMVQGIAGGISTDVFSAFLDAPPPAVAAAAAGEQPGRDSGVSRAALEASWYLSGETVLCLSVLLYS